MPHSTYHPMVTVLLIATVSALAFIPGIASLPPLDSPIAGVEASTALPPHSTVFGWLQRGFAHVFGAESMLAYRLPSLGAGFIIVGLSFIFARSLLPSGEAILTTAFLAVTMMLVAMSHFATQYTLLSASILAQQFALWRIYHAHAKGHYVSGRWAVMLWLAMALGIIMGGTVTGGIITAQSLWLAPATAFLTMLVFACLMRQARWLWGIRPILGFVILTAIIVPWGIIGNHSQDGLLIPSQDQFSANLPIPYPMLLALGFWPASLLALRGVIMIWHKRYEPQVLFLVSWIVPFWLILMVGDLTLPQYLLPITPAVVILLGLGLAMATPTALPSTPKDRGRIKNLNFGRRIILVWDGVFILISLAVGIAVLYCASIFDGARGWGAVALALSIVIAVLAWRWHKAQKPALLIAIVLTAAAFHATVFGGVLPSLDAIHIAPRLKAAIASLTPQPTTIALVGYHAPSAIFALGSDILLFDARNAALFLAESQLVPISGGLSSGDLSSEGLGAGGLAVVEKRQIADFLATAQKANIATSLEGGISGFDSMTGQAVELQFYRLADR